MLQFASWSKNILMTHFQFLCEVACSCIYLLVLYAAYFAAQLHIIFTFISLYLYAR